MNYLVSSSREVALSLARERYESARARYESAREDGDLRATKHAAFWLEIASQQDE
jgi:hypothetical protein